MTELRAPFPYPGGKSRIAEIVWSALGDVASYLEPFCGSCAVLLGRPGGAGKYELVNDANGLVVNVWRALKFAPSSVAKFCDDPPSEVDLRARAAELKKRAASLTASLEEYPEGFDAQAAGWWIWCQAVGLGPDWFSQTRPSMIKPYRRGILSPEATPAHEWFAAIQKRIERVGLACGDFERLLTESALGFNNTGTTPTGIFADPPYPGEALDYDSAPDVAQRFAAWALMHGNDDRLRIVLAGHEGDYTLPGWRVVNWGGSRGWGRERRGDNECLWLSPHCEQQRNLFSKVGT